MKVLGKVCSPYAAAGCPSVASRATWQRWRVCLAHGYAPYSTARVSARTTGPRTSLLRSASLAVCVSPCPRMSGATTRYLCWNNGKH